jgi:hypothetical protein
MPTNTELKLAARAAGEKFYNTGSPCKQGHYSKRYASTGQCVECMTWRSPSTLSEAQAMAVRRYTLSFLLPLEVSDAQLAYLDEYLVRCALACMQAQNLKTPCASLSNAITMHEHTGKPVREYLD